MGGRILKFKKNPRYVHQRSEGLTKRGEARQARLMLGPRRAVETTTLTQSILTPIKVD